MYAVFCEFSVSFQLPSPTGRRDAVALRFDVERVRRTHGTVDGLSVLFCYARA